MTDLSNDVTIHGYAANGGSLASRPVAGYADPVLTELERRIKVLQEALDVCRAECTSRSYGLVRVAHYGEFGGAAEALADALAVLISDRATYKAERDARLAAEARAREVRG